MQVIVALGRCSVSFPGFFRCQTARQIKAARCYSLLRYDSTTACVGHGTKPSGHPELRKGPHLQGGQGCYWHGEFFQCLQGSSARKASPRANGTSCPTVTPFMMGNKGGWKEEESFFFVNSGDTVNALPADDLTTTVVRMSILSNTIRPLFVPQYDGNEGIFLDIQYHQVRDHGAAAGQSGTHAVKGYWSRSFDSPLVHIPFQPIHLVFPFSGGYV